MNLQDRSELKTVIRQLEILTAYATERMFECGMHHNVSIEYWENAKAILLEHKGEKLMEGTPLTESELLDECQRIDVHLKLAGELDPQARMLKLGELSEVHRLQKLNISK